MAATTQHLEKKFSSILLKWNKEKNRRQMPWKGEKDPYKIWLSEIILQQTRVEQGLAYYNAFIKTFPTVQQLAKAPDEKVFKLWEGLGYYSPCRNLLHAARYMANELNGKFPGTYESIQSLKGVGPYTAAAISSFAFNLPYAVVDGNVFRVLSRIFGITIATDSTEGKKLFSQLAQNLLDKKQPGIYNQAIMDFGAVICKPQSPLCEECYFKKDCVAFLTGRINELPVKEKKIKIRKRWFYYVVFEYGNEVLVSQRTQKDIWQGLYEFPLIELPAEADEEEIVQAIKNKKWTTIKKKQIGFSPSFSQQLSHQLISGRFITVQLDKKIDTVNNLQWVRVKQLKTLAFPKFMYNQLNKIYEEIQ